MVSSATGFWVLAAPTRIFEVKGLSGPEKPEILFHIGQCFAGLEIFQDACFDGGANGAEESIGIGLMANVGSRGVLGEDFTSGFRMPGGVETTESAP